MVGSTWNATMRFIYFYHIIIVLVLQSINTMNSFQRGKYILMTCLNLLLLVPMMVSLSPPKQRNQKTIPVKIPQRYHSIRSPIHQNPYPSLLHTIHVAQLLTENEASKCLSLAKEYAQLTGCWSVRDTTRHVSYSTSDFPVEDCDALQSYLTQIRFEKKTFELIGELFDLDMDDLSFLDLFCARYTGKGTNHDVVMDRLNSHRDGSLISFTIVLSSPNDYEGGGTEFDALKDVGENYCQVENLLSNGGVVRVRSAGEGVIHSGKIKHGVHTVTSGERITLTGFVDVDECCIRQGVLSNACRDWGRMDNAKRRLARQNQMISSQSVTNGLMVPSRNGWTLSNSKYLGRGKRGGSCHVEGFIPAFRSVDRRGSDEFQNQMNLETEDILLRDILLPKDKRMERRMDVLEFQDVSSFDDVTIL
jgi:hypothetical protein